MSILSIIKKIVSTFFNTEKQTTRVYRGMKYKYAFDEIVFKSGNKARIIIMKDEKYRMIPQFLISDIQGGDAEYVFSAIDNVVAGVVPYKVLNGNVCGVEIHKEKTQICDNLAEDGMGDWCEIETTELRKLVEIWVNEVKRFKKTHEQH